MRTRSRNSIIFDIALTIAVIVALTIWNFGQSPASTPFSRMVVYGAGVPDSYGSRIAQFNLYQNATGSWVIASYVNYTLFTNGTTMSFPASQHTIVSVTVYLNSTLAVNLTQAIARTRVYLTIAGVTTDAVMTSRSGLNATGGFYTLYYDYPSTILSPTSTWVPAADTTYTMTSRYQAFY